MLQGYIKKFNKNKLNSNLEVFKLYLKLQLLSLTELNNNLEVFK